LPPGYPLNLELKRRRADGARFAASLAAAIAGRPNVVVSSFDHELLAVVRAALPDAALAPLARDDAATLLAAGDRLAAWSLHCHRRLADGALSAAARAAGRHLLVYTVNDAADALALFDLGVAGVFSDWPAQLLAALRAGHPGR
jgi:glycerophosphoryl diester phosphodiesterase